MTRRVPLRDTAKALEAEVRRLAGEYERQLKWHALRVANRHAQQIAPVDRGGARFNLNPSAGSPEPLLAPYGPKYGAPGSGRLLPLRDQLDPGVHAFLTFHALDKRGVFDYAGIMLEEGWSSQAPAGVIGPTKEHVESQSAVINRKAARDTMREAA